MESNGSSVNDNIPWVEKYRPVQFHDIVLDSYNRRFFTNIIEGKSPYFPNLLLYGPPGTGKTTSVMNLIQEIQNRRPADSGRLESKKGSLSNVIHLNASDERGIDIIRHQINLFISSSNLFDTGMKFVILDEVDYMTKLAQHALKYILQTCTFKNVRFFLICNYISKIDESLQREFICIQFNQLPRLDIHDLLHHICIKEDIQWSPRQIETLIDFFQYDIRSMINFLQLNRHDIIDDVVLQTLHETYCEKTPDQIIAHVGELGQKLNLHEHEIVKKYLTKQAISAPWNSEEELSRFLNFADILVHNMENPVFLELWCRPPWRTRA